MRHEALLELFARAPELLLELLRTRPGLRLPSYSEVQLVTHPKQAAAFPELAVLSAMAHGSGRRGAHVALTALAAALTLDEDRSRLYTDIVLASLSEAARRALEEQMSTGRYEYQSEFARKYVAEGKAEGRAAAVLAVLEARRIVVSTEAAARITSCTDIATLDAWVRRAATARSVDELFA